MKNRHFFILLITFTLLITLTTEAKAATTIQASGTWYYENGLVLTGTIEGVLHEPIIGRFTGTMAGQPVDCAIGAQSRNTMKFITFSCENGTTARIKGITTGYEPPGGSTGIYKGSIKP